MQWELHLNGWRCKYESRVSALCDITANVPILPLATIGRERDFLMGIPSIQFYCGAGGAADEAAALLTIPTFSFYCVCFKWG